MIHIAATFDNNYAQHAGVMFTSLIENCSDKASLHIHLITNGLSDSNITMLSNVFEMYNVKSQIHTIKSFDQLKNAPVQKGDHVSIVAYYRILLPMIIDEQIHNIIYLDPDLIVNGDISYLTSYFDGDSAISMANHPPVSDEKYYNTGVAVINLKYWRDNNVTARLIDYINNNPEKLKFWDQDAINGELINEISEIPYAWNVVHRWYSTTADKCNMDNFSFQSILDNPQIVHYTGAADCKPWFRECSHPRKDDYYKYLVMSPWADFKPMYALSLKNRLKSLICKLFR